MTILIRRCVINLDGSATFAGNGESGGNPVGSDLQTARCCVPRENIKYFPRLTLVVNQLASFKATKNWRRSSPNVVINNDGSASFAAQVSTISLHSEYSIVTTQKTANQGIFVGSTDPTTPTTDNSNIHLKGDGSASFAGRLDVDVVDDAANKVVISAKGSTTDDSQGGEFTYRNDGACYWRNKDGNDNVVFAADGSATFAGNVGIGTDPPSGHKLEVNGTSVFRSGIHVSAGGFAWTGSGLPTTYIGENRIDLYKKDDDAAPFLSCNPITAADNTLKPLVCRIDLDGSATFASTLFVRPDATKAAQVELANSPDGGVIYVRDDESNRLIELNGSDGSATFASSVISGGNPASGTAMEVA